MRQVPGVMRVVNLTGGLQVSGCAVCMLLRMLYHFLQFSTLLQLWRLCQSLGL